jgi:hypothetical protein
MRDYKTTARQREQARAWQQANPWRHIWLRARHRARKTGRAFTITEADVAAAWPRDGNCPVFATPMLRPGADLGTSQCGPRDNSPSLDRIDSALGYEPGNIAIISWRANRIKDLAAAHEFEAIARWMRFRELI